MRRRRHFFLSHAQPKCPEHKRPPNCSKRFKLPTQHIMTDEGPAIPKKYFFYNLKQSIDDPYKSWSEASLGSLTGKFVETSKDASMASSDDTAEDQELITKANKELASSEIPLYSQTTLRRTISPVIEWIPFNPGDNERIVEGGKKNPDAPVAVGHERLMFEICNQEVLKPIYWSIPYTTKVTGCHWVFSSTLTPIDPAWDTAILQHYKNFIDNLQTYHEILEKSVADPQFLKVIVQRLDLKQAGKDLAVDLLFSPKTSEVYIFKSEGSYVCTKNTADCLLNGTVPRGVIAVLKPFDFQEYKNYYKEPARESDDPNYTPLPVNNVIMVFHGIGQKLSNSYSRINFVYAIDKLRVEIQHAIDSPDVHQHFSNGNPQSVRTLVVAVNWRSAFNSDTKINVANVTVPSLPMFRQAFSDALLDIPMYMSENHRPDMLAAAASEANRLHDLVRKHHPTFAENGRTHIVGHSLGSLITADLLTHQPTILDENTIEKAPFKFQTYNFFTTGSMLGVFLLLKGKCLVPRKEFDEQNAAAGMSVEPQERPFGCFSVRNLYNIIDQNDLLSFLVNATVKGSKDPESQNIVGKTGIPMETDVLPACPLAPSRIFSSTTLPTTPTMTPPSLKVSPSKPTSPKESSSPKDSSTPQPKDSYYSLMQYDGAEPSTPPVETKLTPPKSLTSSSSISRFLSSQFFRSNPKDDASYEMAEEESDEKTYCKPPESVNELFARFRALNENGQLDWMIPQTFGYIPSHYIKMFTAHFDYWSNKELARFLAIECGREPGIENTVQAHRAKWSYQSPPE